MKLLYKLIIVSLLLVINACADSTDTGLANTEQTDDLQGNVSLLQFAEEMFEQDENSVPMNLDRLNMNSEEETQNTAFDHILPEEEQQ